MNTKKLSLNKETMRALAGVELAPVGGAGVHTERGATCPCYPNSYYCTEFCQTGQQPSARFIDGGCY